MIRSYLCAASRSDRLRHLHSEPVCCLAALFYLLAVILFITGFEQKGLNKASLYFGAFFSFLLGLGVKETVLTLPFIIALLSFYLITVPGKSIVGEGLVPSLFGRPQGPPLQQFLRFNGIFRVNRTDIIISGLWLLTLPVFALVKYMSVGHLIPVDTRFGPGEILPPYQYCLQS